MWYTRTNMSEANFKKTAIGLGLIAVASYLVYPDLAKIAVNSWSELMTDAGEYAHNSLQNLIDGEGIKVSIPPVEVFQHGAKLLGPVATLLATLATIRFFVRRSINNSSQT